MDSALSILGFYFTLIGFISGLFFTRLDSWYGQVREFWGSVRLLEKEQDKIDKSKKARITSNGLRESAPKGSFVAIGFFTTILAVLSTFIPVQVPQVNPVIFLTLPLFATVLMYWIGGYILFRKGKELLEKIDSQIEKILPRQL
jgi:hypothetical protein